MVGSPPELGAWDPAQAVPLQTSDRQYPVWRSPEVQIPREAPEPVTYKYVMVFSGAAVQWEVGPNRVLQPGALLEGTANLVEDAMFDLDDTLARRSSGVRIRFQEALERGADTSRFASSVPSPLRTTEGQTPVEKSPRGCMRELESVHRELVKLKPHHPKAHAEICRAAAAVKVAIEAERSSARGRCRPRSCGFASLSLLMVPVLPMLVGSAILWRVPATRSIELRRALPWLPAPSGEEAPQGRDGVARRGRRGDRERSSSSEGRRRIRWPSRR